MSSSSHGCAAALLAVMLAAIAVACGDTRAPRTEPAGEEERTRTEVLKAGSEVLQADAPADALDVYLAGFHPMKEEPEHQMEAHHFCRQVNEDFAQCALFDASTGDANLNGIEYIISEKLFEELPAQEKAFWHPHNYEILSGQLVAPGIPDVAEKELMRSKINSYGKTWHVWNTGGSRDAAGDPLPYGDARLAWSFNADGEADPALLESRERAMDLDTPETRRERQELVPLARPQRGVDALADAFPERQPIPGVEAKDGAAGAR